MVLMTACNVVSHAQTSSAELAVIVHPDNATSSLTYPELRLILRLDQQYWSPGVPISLMLPGPSAPERARTLEKAFQLSEQGFRQHWIALAYGVQALNLPRPYTECSTAVRVVSSLKTAMAVVNRSCLQGQGVKVLKIDGNKPGDPKYKL